LQNQNGKKNNINFNDQNKDNNNNNNNNDDDDDDMILYSNNRNSAETPTRFTMSKQPMGISNSGGIKMGAISVKKSSGDKNNHNNFHHRNNNNHNNNNENNSSTHTAVAKGGPSIDDIDLISDTESLASFTSVSFKK